MTNEMGKNNFKEVVKRNEETLLDSVFPMQETPLQCYLEEIASKEAGERLEADKYRMAIENPLNGGFFLDSIIKESRGTEEEYFNSVVRFSGLEGVPFSTYIAVKSGEIKDSSVRENFAKASVRYEEHLRASVTSTQMKEYLFGKVFRAILGDYRGLVWQL